MIAIGLIILAPLFAAILILVLRRSSFEIALVGAGVSFIASLALQFGTKTSIVLPGLPNMPLLLMATPLTALLSLTVATVAAFVLVYATGYMAQDKEKNRFFTTMLLFISAMQTLVLAGDWILLLSAWEIIGLSSYLLIGFWYQKDGVKSAATRAFMVTRSADLGLYIAIFILIASSGTNEIVATLNTGGSAAIMAGIFLLIAAMGKSAQTPFHDWLQKAMAGPTPVSALLHSATLVAAGAILLIRTAPMLPPETLLVVGVVGGITTVLTGLIALGETDLKRLLAASTSSQYGLMLLAVGAGVPVAALLHLIAHAVIKSTLFLGAGVFQHTRESTTLSDLEGAGRDRPRIFLGFAIAALALAGIPPLSGFFSKDAVIAATMVATHAWLFAPLALIGTLLTGAYMARTIKILWQGKAKQTRTSGIRWMGAGITGLVVLVVTLGAMFSPIESYLLTELPTNYLAVILGLSAALSGLLLGWLLPVNSLLGPLRPMANHGFQVAGGIDNLFVRPALAIAHVCEKTERRLYSAVLAIGQFNLKVAMKTRLSDEKGIDRLIFLIVNNTLKLGSQARALQSGLIHRELAITVLLTSGLVAVALVGLIIF